MVTSFWSFHRPHIHYTESTEIYTSMMLKALALSVAGVFIPIFLYTSGVELVTILLFLVIFSAWRVGLSFVIGPIIAKFGGKRALSISYIGIFLYISMLLWNQESWWLLVVVAFVGAVADTLQWIGLHDAFSAATVGKSSKSFSLLMVATSAGAAAGPLIGGLIATSPYGLRAALGVSLVILLAAVVPLFATGEQSKETGYNLRKVSLRKVFRYTAGHSLGALEGFVLLTVWPLFVFLYLGDYAAVGAVMTLALLCSMSFSYFAGKASGAGYGRMLVGAGSIVAAVIGFARTFASTFLQILAINIASDAARSSTVVPVMGEFYDFARRVGRIELIVIVEAAVSAVRALTLLIAVGLILAGVSQQVVFGFIFGVAGLGILGFNLVFKNN